MKCRLVFAVTTILFLTSVQMFAQRRNLEASTDVAFSEASPDVAFWVAYWAKPRVLIFGPEQEAFDQNVHEILFPWNDHDDPSNPNVLDDNVQWLKDHASVRFYIEGYASSRGDLGYNLTLSMRRADWVKQTLISKGIAENRIRSAVGWGQLYPVCPELNDDCWSKNRVVRLVYSPNRETQ
jgi:outer membrane protein OmpA-like peptidoglycan-associated protein